MIPLFAALCLLQPSIPVLATIDGLAIDPTERKATVYVFLTPDCPIANDSQPALEKIYQKYKDSSVKLVGVYIDPHLGKDQLLAHKADYGFHYDQVLDAKHDLVRALKASVTPEAFVVNSRGTIKYQGRINDSYSDLGVRKKVKSDDLDSAIAAVLAGRDPKPAKTPAFGCVIPDLANF